MTRLPDKTLAMLDGAAARIRRIYLLRGLAATLAALLASAVAVMAVDMNFVIFADGVRWALTLAVYLVVALVAAISVVMPLFRDLGHLRVAKIIDGRHPEFEECFTTVVELAEPGEGKGPAFSDALFEILCRKSEECAAKVDLGKEFTSRTVVRRLGLLAIASVLLGVFFVVMPQVAGRLFVRAVAPWVDVGNLYSGDIAVTPGDLLVLDGTSIRIEAAVKSGITAEPMIRISRKTAHGWSEEFAEPMSGGVYETVATVAEREWRYRVSAGPAVSRYFRVKVGEMPKYRTLLAKIEYPEYTGIAAEVRSNDEARAVSAYEGSRVSFELSLPDGVSADFRLAGKALTEVTLVSNRVTRWTLDLSNADGFRAPRIEGTVRGVIDIAPTVLIEKPSAKTIAIPAHSKFPLEISVSDDLAVSDPVLLMRRKGEWSVLRPVSGWRRAGATLWKGGDEIDLSEFDFADERSVEFAVAVKDSCPAEFRGPHSVTSTPVTVRFEVRAKDFSRQKLEEMKKAADGLVKEARKRIDDALRGAESAKDRVRRENKTDESLQKQLEKTLHEASEAAKRTKELKERLEEDARFSPMAERLSKLVEKKLEPALNELRKAEFDDNERKEEELSEAIGKLRDAAAELKRFEERLDERTEDVDRLERTKDLAARQDQLAKAAESILEERPVDTKKLEAWKDMEKDAERDARELNSKDKRESIDAAREEMKSAMALMDDLKRELEKEAKAAKERERAEKSGDAKALERLDRKEAAAEQKAEKAAKKAEAREKRSLEQSAIAAEKAREAAEKAASERRNASEAQKSAAKAQEEAAAEQRAAAEKAAKAAESGSAEDRRQAQAAAEKARQRQERAMESQRKAKEASSEATKAQLEADRLEREAERLKGDQDGDSAEDLEKRAESLRDAEHEQQRAVTFQNNAVAAQKRAEAAEARGDKSAAERERAQVAQSQAEAEQAQQDAAKALERAEHPPKDTTEDERLASAAAESVQEDLERTGEAVDEGDFAKASEAAREALEAEEEAYRAMKYLSRNPTLDGDAEELLEKAMRSEREAMESTRQALRASDRSANNPRDLSSRREAEFRARDARFAHEEAAERLEEARRVQAEAEAQRGRRDGSDMDRNEDGDKGQSAASEARKAAEKLADSVARQQAALGINPQEDARQEEGRSDSQEEADGKGGKGGKDESRSGGGQILNAIVKKAKELTRNDDPEAVKANFEKSGWFKIRGSANQGLTEKDLRAIPAEYRELVRAYFLKLSEEQ